MTASSLRTAHAPQAYLIARNFGAQVLSWRPQDADEVLWVSPLASLHTPSPIRGGIPICLPWFGQPARSAAIDTQQAPSHGFARNLEWETVQGTGEETLRYRLTHTPSASGQLEATTRGKTSAEHWALYPHSFEAELSLRAQQTLELSLTVTNTDDHSFVFENAFHTYFRVSDVRSVHLEGLAGEPFFDGLVGFTPGICEPRMIFIGPTDRVVTCNAPVTLHDPGFSRTIRIETQGFGSRIVWTPWEEGTRSMADIPNEEWTNFLCVEAGNAFGTERRIEAGQTLEMVMKVSVESFPGA
ncbi:D-hexose-6-phosphate mutarotase [Schaalia sp. Marseille-Q2122]|uniref:D-hexose-6-phosphate mutarotase n=1 Tax=Schaalia sp. Marseille-Q2122 TaxID=2736604 RepID=UPI00158C4400|nr:D-hexose-6-phosphate mutarotase [Schaalia sp. Marseille-Q2122]